MAALNLLQAPHHRHLPGVNFVMLLLVGEHHEDRPGGSLGGVQRLEAWKARTEASQDSPGVVRCSHKRTATFSLRFNLGPLIHGV